MIGQGFFSDDRVLPYVVLATEDAFQKNFKSLLIAMDDLENGYECSNLIIKNASSSILDENNFLIKAKECKGIGKYKGEITTADILITISNLISGSSRLTIKNGSAYLDTDYMLDSRYKVIGGLGTRTYNQIFNLTENYSDISQIVFGKISGSIHDDMNIKAGKLIRMHDLSTHLAKTGEIYSGGVDLFCAGLIRTVEDGAKIGVHSWRDGTVEASNLPRDDPAHNAFKAYLNEMLGYPTGEEFYFFTIYAAPADGIHIMNQDEIDKYKITTKD